MSSIKQNRHIARLIVGAMSIDGFLSPEEQQKVAATLEELHMPELIADVGAALDNDCGTFNMFEESKELMDSLGSDAEELAPVIFRLIASVVASDRFVSTQEASYLSALARRFKLSTEKSKKLFKSVMAERRGRLEASGENINEEIHPHLKDLLSFRGADELVGELDEDSLEEKLHQAQAAMTEDCEYSSDDVLRALTVLGLDRTSTLESAKEVWRQTIDELELPKMAQLGETFVTAAINRITRINDAYKSVLHFHEHLESTKQAATDCERLQKKIEREKLPSEGEDYTEQLETEMTGVGVGTMPVEE